MIDVDENTRRLDDCHKRAAEQLHALLPNIDSPGDYLSYILTLVTELRWEHIGAKPMDDTDRHSKALLLSNLAIAYCAHTQARVLARTKETNDADRPR